MSRTKHRLRVSYCPHHRHRRDVNIVVSGVPRDRHLSFRPETRTEDNRQTGETEFTGNDTF